MAVATVRTIGTKRARKIVAQPNRSKNAWARVTYSGRNSFELGRSNTTGPTRYPIQ